MERNFLYFRQELTGPENQTKKSFPVNFLSRDVFIIFTAVKHREIPCEVSLSTI